MAIPGMPWIKWWLVCAPEKGAGQAGLISPIGIFGGTFDPVHNGHLQVADEVRRGLAIEDFRLLPAGEPPHRPQTYAGPAHRLAMLELAVREYPGLRLDTREMERPGPSFMVDTLASLREEYPETPLLMVIGQDSASQLHTWHRWRDIPGYTHIVVINRPGRHGQYQGSLRDELEARMTEDVGKLMDRPAGLVLRFRVTAMDLSSTQVRELIATGGDTTACLPAPVAAYIARKGLYA